MGIFALVISLASLASLTLAVTDTATVSVNVAGVSQIEVVPTAFSFSGLTPGSENFTTTTNALIIKNTGSNDVTQIYASLNTIAVENSNPLGQAASQYAAGGFLWIRNSTNPTYYHGGRLEWNTTTKPAGITDVTGAVSWGFYRNATQGDYLWEMVGNGTGAVGPSNWCNQTTGTAAKLVIKNVPDTGNNRDLNTDTTTYQVSTAAVNWGVIAASSGPLNGYCIALYYDCSKFYIYKYDKTTYGSSCANSLYLQESTLKPGEEHDAYIGISIPKGVPAGDTAITTLTITAT
jgi:hypothetical protein